MTHVATGTLGLHAGEPNTLDIGVLADGEGSPIDFGSGGAEEPVVTLIRLDGSEVLAATGAPTQLWPVEMEESETHWVAGFTTLAVQPGERLRAIVEFTDPDGNPVTLTYRVNVVPAV